MKLLTKAVYLFFRKPANITDNPPQIRFFDVYYTYPLIVGFNANCEETPIVGFLVEDK